MRKTPGKIKNGEDLISTDCSFSSLWYLTPYVLEKLNYRDSLFFGTGNRPSSRWWIHDFVKSLSLSREYIVIIIVLTSLEIRS